MIAIIEPQVKASGHEAINSAFLLGISKAFPNEKLCFYADPSHILAIQKFFEINHIEIKTLEYHPFPIPDLSYYRLKTTWKIRSLFKSLFSEIRARGISKLFFLSVTSDSLFAIKTLKKYPFSYTFVLHGILEWISDGPYDPYPSKIHKFLLNFKRAMEWRHASRYRYIMLSPHIIPEASKIINLEKLNISTVYLPFLFSNKEFQTVIKPAITFATIGKGSPEKVKRIANQLNENKKNAYEIRILGGNVKDIEQIENVNCVSPHKRLTREEIEENIKEVDVLLMLYEADAYKLSCSGALFESFSYCKPIIFLNNPCINHFNNLKSIGYSCETISEVVETMQHMIQTYPDIRDELADKRENIKQLRSIIDVNNNIETFKQITSNHQSFSD